MKKLSLYENAQGTGSFESGDDLDWLRISFVFEALSGGGFPVERFNLSDSPTEFSSNEVVLKEMEKNEDCLPLTLLDGELVKTGSYPTNEEIEDWLEVRFVQESSGCGGCGSGGGCGSDAGGCGGCGGGCY